MTEVFQSTHNNFETIFEKQIPVELVKWDEFFNSGTIIIAIFLNQINSTNSTQIFNSANFYSPESPLTVQKLQER